MWQRKEREGWSGFDPETASFMGDFNANNTKCLDQRQSVSIWFKLTSWTVIFLTMSELKCIQVYAPWRPWANQQKVLNVVLYKHFVRFYAVKTSFSYPKYLTTCLLSSVRNDFYVLLAESCLVPSDGKLQENEGVFLEVIETKNFCSMLFTVTSTRRFYSSLWFSWTWDFYTPTAKKSGWGLGIVYVISLFTFESSIVLLSYYTLFVNKYICRKIWQKNIPLLVSEIHTKQSTNEENLSLFIKSIW